jgi:hypothetical protein
MKNLQLLLLLLFFTIAHAFAQSAMEIHQRAILVDTHNDVLSNEQINHLDIGKLQTEGTWFAPNKVDWMRRFSPYGVALNMARAQPLSSLTVKLIHFMPY